MSNEIIIASLIKFQDERKFLEDLQKGLLYMNTLRFFRELAEGESEFRGDRFEGLVGWYQPDKVTIKVDGLEINSNSLAAPVAIHWGAVLDLNVFCMYALSFKADQKIRQDQLQDFEDSLRIHRANFGLGKYMLITLNTKEFLKRVKQALYKAQKGGKIKWWRIGLVHYFDDKSFHGKFSEEQWGLVKRKFFAAQREYRIIVDTGSDSPMHGWRESLKGWAKG